MNYKKIILSVSFFAVFGLLFVPIGPAIKGQTITDAQTQALIAQLQQQIAQLLAQIAQLRQLQAQQGTTPAWCHTFNTNLRFGDINKEVSELQNALGKESLIIDDYSAANDGTFTKGTASAVIKFQEKYTTEILTKSGLIRGTGYVGPSTRRKLNALYGCRDVSPNTTQPSITVTSPNGGEQWAKGSTYNITWNSSGLSSLATVNIVLVNISDNWSLIFATAPASNGSYSWTTGSTFSGYVLGETDKQYKIEIYTATLGGTTIAKDMSDNYFTVGPSTTQQCTIDANCPQLGIAICSQTYCPVNKCISGKCNVVNTAQPSITVTSPNGGETWRIGGNHEVRWTSSGVDKVYIIFKNDSNGKTCASPALGTSSTGLYTYNPLVGTTNCPESTLLGDKIRVFVRSIASDSVPSDTSDNYFSIVSSTVQSSIAVTSPNGGEQWTNGSTHNITWASKGVNNVYVTIQNFSGGIGDNSIPLMPASSGVYSYTVPASLPIGSLYKINIKDPITGIQDTSDNYFSIVASSTSPSIKVLSPNGGETWKVGGTHNITWSSVGLQANAALDLFVVDYSTIPNIITTIVKNVSATQNSYSWTIPATFLGSKFKMGTLVYNVPGQIYASDISDNYFSVVASSTQPSIAILSPNGGETLTIGQTYNITWETNAIYKLRIYVFKYAGPDQGLNTIVLDTLASSGSYPWTVRSLSIPIISPGDSYKIFIYGYNEAGSNIASDFSDNYFSVVAPPTSLNNDVQLLASISDAIARIAETIKEMLKR